MRKAAAIAAAITILWIPALTGDQGSGELDHWAQWRGPLGTGVAPRADPPVAWSEGENVRWKTPIPGKGLSTPVVWGDRIFVTTAIPHGEAEASEGGHSPGAHDNVAPSRRQKLVVLAVDRRDGRILWQKVVRTLHPHESTHVTGSWASASPVTDGERVFAFFGSGGLYALSFDGTLAWETDLGKMRVKHGHGEGSSPALHGNTLVVNWDHEGESFLVAIDKRTGKERWRVARDEITSWSSPLIVEVDGKPQVIVAATGRVRGYELKDGNLIWECGGLSGNVVATPVAADGIVYVANSYETRAMLAIRLAGAKGDITGTDAVIWTRNRDTPYVPSPILYGGALCFLKHYQGFLTCVDAKTGETLLGPARLPGIRNVYASPAGAADRIYITDRDGTTLVVRRGPELKPLARNRLDDSFSASPALVGDQLILRGERYLYSVSEAPPDDRKPPEQGTSTSER
jgi:outer membrane protein assembly factor BamB